MTLPWGQWLPPTGPYHTSFRKCNRWREDALLWFKDNLPKSSEAYCALEVGHPQELLLFIYPAGVRHQINIIKCLPARNKYLARKRKYTGSLATVFLMKGVRGIFLTYGKQCFYEQGFHPLSIHLPYPPSTIKKCPKETSLNFITSFTKILTKRIP